MSLRVLVADDEPGLRASLVANLEIEGYDVVEAPDGVEAITRLNDNAFDLVISDMIMPHANGLEVLRAAKQRAAGCPVVLITAFVSDELLAQAIADGAYTVVYKPFAVEKLFHVVARALRGQPLLLVDDAAPYLAGLAESLRSVGMQVTAVEDGESAVAYAKENPVDVCVLDLLLPSMDGVETCQALRQINKNMDVIAITGASNDDIIRRIGKQGVAACLRKPFHVRELLSAIARVRGGPERVAGGAR